MKFDIPLHLFSEFVLSKKVKKNRKLTAGVFLKYASVRREEKHDRKQYTLNFYQIITMMGL